jgi:hypothetical protein
VVEGVIEYLKTFHPGPCYCKAHSGQVCQAQRANSSRAADGYKDQVFDVCMIAVDGNTRGATDKRNIPVLVSQIVPYTSPATKITTHRYKYLTKMSRKKSRQKCFGIQPPFDRNTYGDKHHYSRCISEVIC